MNSLSRAQLEQLGRLTELVKVARFKIERHLRMGASAVGPLARTVRLKIRIVALVLG